MGPPLHCTASVAGAGVTLARGPAPGEALDPRRRPGQLNRRHVAPKRRVNTGVLQVPRVPQGCRLPRRPLCGHVPQNLLHGVLQQGFVARQVNAKLALELLAHTVQREAVRCTRPCEFDQPRFDRGAWRRLGGPGRRGSG